jgi:RNA polymerase sigma-70 factor (ECF subfamily)
MSEAKSTRPDNDRMDDAELVMRLKQYDPEAVSQVVTGYGAALHRYVVAIAGDYHLAEDIVSETYMRMLEHIDTYAYTGAPFGAWLYRIAHNLAINAVRRGRPVAGEDVLAQIVAPDDGPERAVQRGEERAALHQALLTLTEEQQQVLLLRFVSELSIAEVARVLNKSEGSVKQLQFRGLRSLARLLRPAEDGDGI